MHFIFTTEAHEVITKINEKNRTNILVRGGVHSANKKAGKAGHLIILKIMVGITCSNTCSCLYTIA